MIRFLSLQMVLSIAATPLIATPAKVIIVRHAEKNLQGESLDPKGLSRAGALPYFFAFNPLYNEPPISFALAAHLDGPPKLARTYQTCKPSADYFNVSLTTDYAHNDVQGVANDILTNPKYDNSTLLVCWTHGHIGRLVEALGGESPGKWSKDIYDWVYVLDFDKIGRPTVKKELQELMYGDSSNF